ncbi:MAG TPA: OB-fold nucleic acid binding domain-containing protein [Streptosporangiaceae bacterium]|jgi:hypothetical protein|nr:OB-fold nucleic acid binding domain-containing protein [Streptosporangiaceae bacterium]
MGNAIHQADFGERPRVRVAGTVRVIRHDRIGGMPALEAELCDGSCHIDLVWLGRRRIVGIETGSTVVAEGRLGIRHGRTTMFNPRYELRAGDLRAAKPCSAGARATDVCAVVM